MDDRAVCWCLAGAIDRCYPSSDNTLVRRLVQNKIGGIGIADFNDDSARTHAEVLALVEELDI